MKKLIGITDDLADVFMIQALKEGFCDHLAGRSQAQRDSFAQYMMQQNGFNKEEYTNRFSQLSLLLMMYDTIDLPILNTGFVLHGEIERMAKIRSDFPEEYYEDRLLDMDLLSIEDAKKLKPFVMSAIKNITFYDRYIAYAVERSGSIDGLFSVFFDMLYGGPDDIWDSNLSLDYISACTKKDEGEIFDYPCPESFILYTKKVINTLLKELLIFLRVNKLGKYDYYSRVFENFSTEKDLSLAYGMVKTQISYIMELQPAFESLSEIISFKQKKKRAIKDLQEEVSHLEALIKEGASEAALQKVIQDVRSANESLIKGTATKRIARVATYCSVPIALTEALLFGTPYSSMISVVGTVAQLIIDLKNRQSDWLFVAR